MAKVKDERAVVGKTCSGFCIGDDIYAKETLDSVNPKMRVKIFGLMGILQEKGNMLRAPYGKHLDGGIFELCCKYGSDITRVLYFFLL